MIMPDDGHLAPNRCRKGTTAMWGKRLALAALAALATLTFAGAGIAQRGEPRITVAATIVAEAASQTAVQIQAGPADAIPGNSFIRLRGLPPSVSLSDGYSIGPGSWAVPLLGLSGLKAVIPAGVSGRSELTISLVGVDGTLLAEAKTAFVVGPSAMMAPGDSQRQSSNLVPPRPLPARPLLPRVPDLAPEEKDRAEKLMAQGERQLQQGSIVLAREFFRRAADAGFAPAAIRLASTYDPGELSRLGVKGVVPDRAEAKKWYERARELGAPEAEERLARLGDS
jgi:TPR repeat protein